MFGGVMDADYVLVVGPHGRHIEVHKTTQAAFPDLYPLVKTRTRTVKPVAKKKPASKAATGKKES